MDSDEYNTDEGRRKRKGEEDIFKISKKTSRSPGKEERYSGSMMERMMEMMENVTRDIKDIKMDQRKNREDMKMLQKEIKELRKEQVDHKEELKKIKEIYESAMTEIDSLRQELTEANGKITKLEEEKRKKNIIMQGLTINSNDRNIIKEEMGNFIKEKLEIEIKINNAVKLGNATCMLELDNLDEKIAVMKNKYKLKTVRNERVFINDDMTKEERGIQKEIRRIAKEEINKGTVVKVGYQKLIKDGQVWRWNKARHRLEGTKAKN